MRSQWIGLWCVAILWLGLVHVSCGQDAESPASQPTHLEVGYLLGTVVDSSSQEAIAGARVYVDAIADTSSSDGSFELREIRTGHRVVELSKDGYQFRTDSLIIAAGENSHDFALVPENVDEPVTPICTEFPGTTPPPNELHHAAVGIAGNRWTSTQVTVRFLHGNPLLQEKVKQYAVEWSDYANIRFLFGDYGNADIRVSMRGLGHKSAIGTEALRFPSSQPTMNLELYPWTADNEIRRVTLHEFGHALGLAHEHQGPAAGINWNEPLVIEYHRVNDGWDEKEVRRNVFSKYEVPHYHHTEYDSESIMHYAIDPWMTTDGYWVPWNNDLSNRDKAFIALWYPSFEAEEHGDISAVYASQRQHAEFFFERRDGYMHYFYADPHWKNDGTPFMAEPVAGAISAVFASHRGHSEVFHRGDDGFLNYYYANPLWTRDVESFRAAGQVTGEISAVYAHQRQHSEVFFRGHDGYLHYFYAAPGWTHDGESFRVAGRVEGDISAVYAPRRNHAEVFFRGQDGYLHYYYAEPYWTHDGTSFRDAGEVDGDIAAVFSSRRNHSEVFFRASDGYLHYYYADPFWTHDGESFRSGGRVDGDIAAVFSEQRNHSEVFYRGADGYLHYFYADPHWTHDTQSFRKAGRVAGAITALWAPRRNHSEVFFRGEDGYIHYFYVENGSWKHDARSFADG